MSDLVVNNRHNCRALNLERPYLGLSMPTEVKRRLVEIMNYHEASASHVIVALIEREYKAINK